MTYVRGQHIWTGHYGRTDRRAARQRQQKGFLGEVVPSLSLGGIGHGGRWYKTFLHDISPGLPICSAADSPPGPASPTNKVREEGNRPASAHLLPKPREAGKGKPVSCREAEC